MSDKTIANLLEKELNAGQANAVSGGDGSCTVVNEVATGAYQSVSIYEALVDFTSHVIERLANTK